MAPETTQSEKLGTEHLTALVDMGLVLVKAGEKAAADGHISFTDLGYLAEVVPTVGPAVAGLGQDIPELQDLSTEEAEALVAHVIEKLAVDSDKARRIVEASLKAAVAAYGLVQAVRS